MAGKGAVGALRTMVAHFAGGTEVSLQTSTTPASVYEALEGDRTWLVVEDQMGEPHYLAVAQIAYLTFSAKKGVGFGL